MIHIKSIKNTALAIIVINIHFGEKKFNKKKKKDFEDFCRV